MYVVGIGGTVSPSSSSDRALRIALDHVQGLGATTRMFSGEFLRNLPMYDPADPHRTPEAQELVAELRSASGVIVSSAAYHGSISGMLKNALDYTEDMAHDERVYLAGLPVGLITVAKGWQAGSNTLSALRSITHALRGWPTPYGCVINTTKGSGSEEDPVTAKDEELALVAREVVFAVRGLTASRLALTGSRP